MEGIHLRGSRVARGGMCWSDRMEDFLIEVLGLVKAHAVIVLLSSKGGFVGKCLPPAKIVKPTWPKASPATHR